ncbi:MAG: hypothetical protein WA631_07125, partial [Nitrososphaeraceae archaeon]
IYIWLIYVCGVLVEPPQQLDQSYPTSSNIMYVMFGASTGALAGCGQHGFHSSQVHPIDPLNSVLLYIHSYCYI